MKKKRLWRSTPEQRFWHYTEKGRNDSCWIWTGTKHSAQPGYGVIVIGPTGTNRPSTMAHRFSWTLHFGEIPNGMLICHKCDNPLCVNPKHLFLGTFKDNMNDRNSKNRQAHDSRHGRAKVTAEQVVAIRSTPIKRGSISELSRVYGIARSAIRAILSFKTWKQTY